MIRTELFSRRIAPRRGRVHDPDFLRFVGLFACVVCARGLIILRSEYSGDHQRSRTDAAHVGSHGLWQKSSDRETAPLCRFLHHQYGPESHHTLRWRFWSFHKLDKKFIVGELNRLYELR